VVGVPGDRVELKKRELVINGVASKYEKLDPERVLNSPATEYYQVFEESIGDHRHLVMFRRDQEDDGFGPQVIPEGHVFVLGDNRDSSDDSRNWGLVPTSKIESHLAFEESENIASQGSITLYFDRSEFIETIIFRMVFLFFILNKLALIKFFINRN
jgi:signal peptidase I